MGSGVWGQDLKIEAWGLGFGGLGFWGWALGCGISDFGCMISGLGFKVWGIRQGPYRQDVVGLRDDPPVDLQGVVRYYVT